MRLAEAHARSVSCHSMLPLEQAFTHAPCCHAPCRPSCFRFPRGNGLGLDLAAHGITKDLKGTPMEVGGSGLSRQMLAQHAGL